MLVESDRRETTTAVIEDLLFKLPWNMYETLSEGKLDKNKKKENDADNDNNTIVQQSNTSNTAVEPSAGGRSGYFPGYSS